MKSKRQPRATPHPAAAALTHLKPNGQPGMVDISTKPVSHRTAVAMAELAMPPEIARLFRGGEWTGPKGPVFHTAIIAATQAVKETSRIIPLCHPLPILSVNLDIRMKGPVARIRCTVTTDYKTGVEMEALTGAAVAALTIYDMCKAVSHAMEIRSVRLLEKAGGRRTVKTS